MVLTFLLHPNQRNEARTGIACQIYKIALHMYGNLVYRPNMKLGLSYLLLEGKFRWRSSFNNLMAFAIALFSVVWPPCVVKFGWGEVHFQTLGRHWNPPQNIMFWARELNQEAWFYLLVTSLFERSVNGKAQFSGVGGGLVIEMEVTCRREWSFGF